MSEAIHTKSATVIPTVLLSNFTEGIDGENTKDNARRLGEAFSEYGFCYLKNHGLEQLCSKALDCARQFFSLPQEKKDQIHNANAFRGYFRFKEEQSGYKDDWKEGIYYLNEKLVITEDSPYRAFRGSNPWPTKEIAPDFQDVISDCFRKMLDVGYELLGGLSLSLGLDEDFFKTKLFSEPFAQIAIFHYPPCTDSVEAEQLWGVGEHSDYGFVTVLLQDDVGGLEAQISSGEWIDVPHVPGSFVINVGDMLEIWSNGAFKSPRHRVKTSPTRHRFSIALFLEPNLDSTISPIPIKNALFSAPKTQTKYQSFNFPLVYGEYVLEKYRKNLPSREKTDKKLD